MHSRFLFLVIAILTGALLTTLPARCQESAKGLARSAYNILLDSPFDRNEVAKAAAIIKQAQSLDQNEPWLYIARAQLIRTAGFLSGSWMDINSYEPGAVDSAIREAQHAVKLNPNIVAAHSILAALYAAKEQYRQAWSELDWYNKLAPNDFTHWNMRGEIYMKIRDLNNAQKMFVVAAGLCKTNDQKMSLLYSYIDLAKARNDNTTAEKYYKEVIKLNPRSAHCWGNYGCYLTSQGKAQEAIPILEKAVSIMPYGGAVAALKWAKEKVAESSED